MSFRLERSGMEKSPILKALKFGDPSTSLGMTKTRNHYMMTFSINSTPLKGFVIRIIQLRNFSFLKIVPVILVMALCEILFLTDLLYIYSDSWQF